MAVTQNHPSPPTIQNVVGTASLNREIDLDMLSEDLPLNKTRKGSFSGGVFYPKQTTASVLVFATGNLTVIGAKSKQEARSSISELFDRLEVLGVDTPEPHVSFDNVVCTSDLGGPVDLTTAAIGLGLEHIEYEPEQFSALQFSPDVDGSSAMFLIFNSGSVTITGVESHEQAKEELDILISELKKVNLYPTE